MLCRAYSTDPYEYRAPRDVPNVAPSVADYYSVPGDPGRIPEGNGERVRGLLGLWEDDQGLLSVLLMLDIVHWPSWLVTRWQISGTTGALTDIEDDAGRIYHVTAEGGPEPAIDGPSPTVLYWNAVVQDDRGALWVRLVTGELRMLSRAPKNIVDALRAAEDPTAPLVKPPETFVYSGNVLDPADYGLISFSVLGIAASFLLIGGDVYGTERQTITVLERAGGAFVRTIHLPEDPVALAHDFGSVWYALLANGAVVSFDYSDGRILQYTQLQLGFDISADSSVKFTWSRRYRRFLVVRQTADVDGVCTIRVHGYRNRPIATHVCKPVPIAPLRAGRVGQFLTRSVGDAGEPVAAQILVDDSDGVTPMRISLAVDGDGDGILYASCDTAGAGSLDVSLNVECTIDAPATSNPFNTPEPAP